MKKGVICFLCACAAAGTFDARADIASTSYFKGSGSVTVTDGTIAVSDASATGKGVVKLYTDSGSGTDGTMTQKAVTDALAGKQATISDLATIRSGAAAGATAVQASVLKTVATTGSYNDLTNKPTIPTVNDATITIQRNGVTVDSFTANAATAKTIDITDNDTTYSTGSATASGLTKLYTDTGAATDGALTQAAVTSALAGKQDSISDLATIRSGAAAGATAVQASALKTVATTGSYDDLTNKPTIPTVNDATITIQRNGVTVDSFTANTATAKTINISDSDTTYGNMGAATASAAGTAGLVPAPAAGKNTAFLRGDGTWAIPTDTNTTYSTGTATASGLTKLYTGTGTATDGTLTQAAITTKIADAVKSVCNGSGCSATMNMWID